MVYTFLLYYKNKFIQCSLPRRNATFFPRQFLYCVGFTVFVWTHKWVTNNLYPTLLFLPTLIFHEKVIFESIF